MNDIKSIEALSQEFKRIVRDLEVDDYYKSFHTTAQHDGSPHIELAEGHFHFVVTERGMELERIAGLTSDDVLYLLFEGITQHMATEYELHHRTERIDGRAVWFPYQEELMRRLNPHWGERLEEEHESVLREYPFR
jgi:hypothetical protein